MLLKQVNPKIKIQVLKIPQVRRWVCSVTDEYNNLRQTTWPNPKAAFKQCEKELQFAHYRIKARTALIPGINVRTVTGKEFEFLRSIIECNCVALTAKQYGYLKGIWERNHERTILDQEINKP